MRIATLQFAPRLGEVEANARRADEVISTADELENADLLVCPEMALSGYNFNSSASMEPHLEPTCAGPTALWAYRTASRLGCLVSIGYPEKTTDPESMPFRVPLDPTTSVPDLCDQLSVFQEKTEPEALSKIYSFNASLVVDPNGNILAHYRKSFLYYTDATWALPSPTGFMTVPLPLMSPRLQDSHLSNNIASSSKTSYKSSEEQKPKESPKPEVTTSFGICMDLNPKYFTAPWEARELATYTLNARASMLLVNTAWLTRLPSIFDNNTTTASLTASADNFRNSLQSESMASPCCPAASSSEPDLDTLTYWLDRLLPLVEASKETIVVIANRVGVEAGVVRGCNLEAVKFPADSKSAEAKAEDILGEPLSNNAGSEQKKHIEIEHEGAEPTESSAVHGIVSHQAHYAGTSTILGLGHNRVRVFGVLGRGEEKVLVVDHTSTGQAVWRLSASDH